jgi:hypothetical protein
MDATPSRLRAMRAFCAVMALMFVFSVVVQYNDPDPVRWMTIYGLAALSCLWGLRGPVPWPAPAVVGVASLVWALTLAPTVLGHVRFGEMFESFEMHEVRVEQGREMGGLLIVTAAMVVLLVLHRRR